MRFIFYSLFSIVAISIFSFLIADSITGGIPVTEGCGPGNTYAIYHTLEEKESVIDRWQQRGFLPLIDYPHAPGFHNEDTGLICMRMMTKEELKQYGLT